ncbi:MAG: fibronectin type III domain-containing protein, partial [bacterium]|nr:fibronectin type III domain-containing protein [bacterium]
NITATDTSVSTIRVSWTHIIYTGDTGSYRVYYSTTPGGPWTFAGSTADKRVSSYNVTGLSSGTRYYFEIQTQTNPHRDNDNTVLSEFSKVVSAVTGSSMAEKDPPFGSFGTPIDGLTARGGIPVTGWALDDSGIDTVKIYRELGSQLIYIGDGVFIEGARPDVAATYPTYPDNTKAGWGYMLLTNFLPNNGNGTFVLHAIATDVKGKTTTLGTKTIHCDNANAVKPFGAIDTPAQGGNASGTGFVNFGWALTPRPNTIPIDGSTITVWVDGVPLGNPVYNKYRSDIAALFPSYNNSNGAIGYFYLDTTGYDNGVHTIQWSVKDDAGNTDGIGSRYFTIQNNQSRARSQTQAMHHRDIRIHDIPLDTMTPLNVKTGYSPEHPDKEKRYRRDEHESARIEIEIPELGRVEFQLTGETGEEEIDPGTFFVGYQMVYNGLRPLPIGSYLDKKRGIFSWQAGLAFLGDYHLVFIKTDSVGNRTRKEVLVTIKPKQ